MAARTPRRKVLSVAHKRLLIEAGRWALDHMPGADQKLLSAALAELAEARAIEAERKRPGPAKGDAHNATPPDELQRIGWKMWKIWEAIAPAKVSAAAWEKMAAGKAGSSMDHVFGIRIDTVLTEWRSRWDAGETGSELMQPPTRHVAKKAVEATREAYEAQWRSVVEVPAEALAAADELDAALACVEMDLRVCTDRAQRAKLTAIRDGLIGEKTRPKTDQQPVLWFKPPSRKKVHDRQ